MGFLALILSIVAIIIAITKKGKAGDPATGGGGGIIRCDVNSDQPICLTDQGVVVKNLIVGSPSNSWSPSGDLMTTGLATFHDQVTITAENGLVLEKGSLGIGKGSNSNSAIYLNADGNIAAKSFTANLPCPGGQQWAAGSRTAPFNTTAPTCSGYVSVTSKDGYPVIPYHTYAIGGKSKVIADTDLIAPKSS